MFNFALVCHHIAKVTGNSRPLQRALQLYRLILRCLAEQQHQLYGEDNL